MSEPVQKLNYALSDKLGTGRNGTVYRAWDNTQRRWCAVKLIHQSRNDDPFFIKQITARTKAVSRTCDPHIATIVEITQVDGQYLIASEFIEGTAVEELVTDEPMSISEFLSLAEKITIALNCAHNSLQTHGNLRPSNIMITSAGEVKLLDFGLAASPTRIAEEIDLEAVRYLAPEHLDGFDPNFSSDLFSLGALFYFMLAGRPPFRGDTVEDLIRSIRLSELDLTGLTNRAVPSEIILVIKKLLSKKPEDRFFNTNELINTIVAIREHLENPNEAELLQRQKTSPRQLIIISAVVVLLMVVWSIIAYFQH